MAIGTLHGNQQAGSKHGQDKRRKADSPSERSQKFPESVLGDGRSCARVQWCEDDEVFEDVRSSSSAPANQADLHYTLCIQSPLEQYNPTH
jgi:hypothetical protein